MPILNAHSLEFISRSADQTRRVGMRLGGLLKIGDAIGLAGNLGSGKTTLVQGLAAGWGSLDPVTSPTFVLINVYRRLDGARLFHLDAFRLADAIQAEDLDIEELLTNGPLVVEWADRIEAALPKERLWVGLRWIADEQRDMVFSAQGKRHLELLSAFRRSVYGSPV